MINRINFIHEYSGYKSSNYNNLLSIITAINNTSVIIETKFTDFFFSFLTKKKNEKKKKVSFRSVRK